MDHILSNVLFIKVVIILIRTTPVLIFNVFFAKDSYVNAVEPFNVTKHVAGVSEKHFIGRPPLRR